MTASRTCGACSACCTALAVPSMGKPAGTLCPHAIRGVGCSIYESRPPECQAFTCLWLLGFSKPGSRPDRSGVLVEGQATKIGATIVAREIWPGAFRSSPRLVKDLNRLPQPDGKGGLYLRTFEGEVTIAGPGAFIAKAQEIVDEAGYAPTRVHLRTIT